MTPGDQDKPFRDLAVRLSAFPLGDYLKSENFKAFCRGHDLEDAWQSGLDLIRDRPDLYGDEVDNHAIALFLRHIYHSRREEFPLLFAGLLAGFAHEVPCDLPLDDLKSDLAVLGYSGMETENAFYRAGARGNGSRAPQEGRSS